MYPHFKSWRLSPAMQAAQQTTAPIMIAAAGPVAEFGPSNTSNTTAENRIVPIVIPDTGLLDVPTRPAMYAETEQNRKPATIMMIVIGTLTPYEPTMFW